MAKKIHTISLSQIILFVMLPLFFTDCSSKRKQTADDTSAVPEFAVSREPKPGLKVLQDEILYRCDDFIHLQVDDTITVRLYDDEELRAVVIRSMENEEGTFTQRAVFEQYEHGYVLLSTFQCVTTGVVSIPERSISKRISTDRVSGLLRVGTPPPGDRIERDSVLIPGRR